MKLSVVMPASRTATRSVRKGGCAAPLDKETIADDASTDAPGNAEGNGRPSLRDLCGGKPRQGMAIRMGQDPPPAIMIIQDADLNTIRMITKRS
jgi:hypothetical protein